MTKSTITRERLEEIVSDPMINQGSEFAMMARMALAAMDSDPVEMPLDYLQGHKDGLEWAAQLAEANHPETGDWLYDDPIELAKAIRKGPDMPPVQPVADSEPVAWTWQHLKQRHVTNDEERARDLAWDGVKVEPLYRHPQPAPVVPDGLRLAISNAGIAAPESDEMLAATCEKYIQALVTWVKDRKPFQSAPVVPTFDEWLEISGNKPLGWVKDAMRESYDACRADMLAAAPHDTPALNSVQSVVTAQGKWIPVSEQKPDCWCRTCRPVVLNDMRFVVCPDCGNKRCPRANDHRDACAGSNEPGQEGSVYPAAQQEVKGE